MTILSEMVLIAVIALPFVGSCFAMLFPANNRNSEAYLSGAIALTDLLLLILTYPKVADGGVVRFKAAWVPDLGLEFYLRLDGFAWLLATLITSIGFLIVLRLLLSVEIPSL